MLGVWSSGDGKGVPDGRPVGDAVASGDFREGVGEVITRLVTSPPTTRSSPLKLTYDGVVKLPRSLAIISALPFCQTWEGGTGGSNMTNGNKRTWGRAERWKGWIGDCRGGKARAVGGGSSPRLAERTRGQPSGKPGGTYRNTRVSSAQIYAHGGP